MRERERNKAADEFVQHLCVEEQSAVFVDTSDTCQCPYSSPTPVPLLYPGSMLARTFRDRGSTHG